MHSDAGRTRSVFHRAGGRFRSETKWTREGMPAVLWIFLPVNREYNLKHAGRRAREACFIAHTECVSSRTQSVFHRAGGLLRSVAHRTREVTPAVLWPSSFCGFLRTWNVRLLRLGLYKYSEFTGKKAFAPGFAEKPKGGTLLYVCRVWKRNGKGMSGTGGRIARCDGFFF